MANKWNTTDIEKISTAFTQKNLQKCFQENDRINGEQIASATDFPQINYFVLHEVFNRWEEDTNRLKSVYFDFDAPEVQKSFADFRNTLSRYILVGKEDFGPLLESAVRKTLQLYIRPEAFFIEDFRSLPDFKLTREWLRKKQVFFKSYDWLIRDLGEAIAGDFIYANQALEEVKRLLANQTEDFTSETDRIAFEAGIVPKASKTPEKEPENDNLSFFERLVANPPKPGSDFREPTVSPFERIAHRVKAETARVEIVTQKASEPVVTVLEEEVLPEIEAVPEILPADPVRTEVVQTRTVVREETRSIFENLNTPTLNDRLSSTEERNTLADVHQRSRIDSLKGSMTLNQRFSFLNSLFGGNLDDFEAALRQVEQCTGFDQARDMLERNYGAKNNWGLRNEDLEELMGLVKRRLD